VIAGLPCPHHAGGDNTGSVHARLGDPVEPAAIVPSEESPIGVSADVGADADRRYTTAGIGAKPRTVAPSLLRHEIEAARIPLAEPEESEVDVERGRSREGFGIARSLCAILTWL
jgi:hypothetical protein